MKNDSTVRKHQRALRRLIEDDSTDLLTRRIAYEIECAIRWAREETVGWPAPAQMAIDAAALLRQELARAPRGTPDTVGPVGVSDPVAP